MTRPNPRNAVHYEWSAAFTQQNFNFTGRGVPDYQFGKKTPARRDRSTGRL